MAKQTPCVFLDKRTGRCYAQVVLSGKKNYLGAFDTEAEAAAAVAKFRAQQHPAQPRKKQPVSLLPKEIRLVPRLTESQRAAVGRHALPHPPCFESQAAWRDWLLWAEASGDPAMSPTKLGPAAAVVRRVPNEAVDFCADCERGVFKVRMQAAGRCRPRWLIDKEYEQEDAA